MMTRNEPELGDTSLSLDWSLLGRLVQCRTLAVLGRSFGPAAFELGERPAAAATTPVVEVEWPGEPA